MKSPRQIKSSCFPFPHWQTGLLAAAALTSAAHAATAQIPLSGHSITLAGIHLLKNLAGDGTADIPLWSGTPNAPTIDLKRYYGSDHPSHYHGIAAAGHDMDSAKYMLVSGNQMSSASPASVQDLFSASFRDRQINGKNPTPARLPFRSYWHNPFDFGMDPPRLLFDNAGPPAPRGVAASSPAYTALATSALSEPSGAPQ